MQDCPDKVTSFLIFRGLSAQVGKKSKEKQQDAVIYTAQNMYFL